MKLIVGLGNPGIKYETTRHNVGFMVLDTFLKDFESTKDTVWTDSKKFKADIAEIVWQPLHGELEKVLLAKPKTFMNNSGMAVGLLAKFYKVKTEDIWVIHDDVDFPVGSLRIRFGGGVAGHRGLESILGVFPEGNFWRFRCGIGRPGHIASGVSDYVLETFDHEDKGKIRELLKRTSKALQMGLEEGLDRAMNKYNTK